MEVLPTETIANIISFLPLDEKHVVKRVSRKWPDAASFAIRHQRSLNLADGSENSIVRKLIRAVEQGVVPDVTGITFFKSDYVNSETEQMILAVLNKVARTVSHLEIGFQNANWITKVFDENVFPDLVTLRLRMNDIPLPLVPTLLAVCPKLTSFGVRNVELFSSLPDRFLELEIGFADRRTPLKRKHFAHFTNLRKLSISGIKLRPHKSLFTGFPHLQQLVVTKTKFCINDQMISNLSQSYPSLQTLVLENGDKPFRHRDGGRCSLTGACIHSLNQMQSLMYLRIKSPQWDVDPVEWEGLQVVKAGNQQLNVMLSKSKSDSFPGSLEWTQDGDFKLRADFGKRELWSLFEKVVNVKKLDLMMTGGQFVTEDAAAVLCYKFQDRLQEMTLSGFQLTDDFLHILLSMRLKKLKIAAGDCTFSAESLLKFMQTKAADGSLEVLDMEVLPFKFTTDQEAAFVELLRATKGWALTLKKYVDEENTSSSDYMEIINFEYCCITEVSRRAQAQEGNTTDSDSDNETISHPGYMSRTDGEELLNQLLARHTNLTFMDLKQYHCSPDVIVQNGRIKKLTLAKSVDDNDLTCFSTLQHLEELVITGRAFSLTAAGLMMLLIGNSSRSIKLIKCEPYIPFASSRLPLKLLLDKVAEINESRGDGQRLVLDLGTEIDALFSEGSPKLTDAYEFLFSDDSDDE